MARWRWRIVFATICLLAFGIWYGLQPGFSSLKSYLFQFLDGCPDGGVRFVCNEPHESYFHMQGYIDLQKGECGIAGDDYNPKNGSITLTCGPNCRLTAPMSPEEKTEAAHLIEKLPARTFMPFEPCDFDDNIYLSLWRNHQLQIYVYPKDDLPDEAKELMNICGPNVASAIQPGS